ncbi:hypothetical protein [Kitasatospora sp. NBC_01266]|uniref:hypothetical protein n=1 Tax=Kitasatospora sp. NBC_01266 TaxID=2903572 RepID=UPI002E30AE1B|nr:hypothetical protein [Kitasatospora sp. NBC_01266]
MSATIPLVALLGLLVFVLLRSNALRLWQVILVGLFGMYLDQTALGEPITITVTSLIVGLTHGH